MSLYGINAYTSNSYYSTLLASRNRQSNNLSSMLSNAFKNNTSDLYAIAKKADLVRSRSYQKELLEGFREYFSGGAAADTTDKTDKKDTSAANDEKLSVTAKKLNETAGALATGGNELYNDADKSVSAVKKFVDSYNSTLDTLQDSENTKALEKGVQMVNSTNAYARTLKRIGITIGNDNRLSIDEGKLKEASPATLKSLFSGKYSLTNRIADKASYIQRTAALSSATTYNAKGTKNDYFNQLSAMMFNSKV
ncbi:MAG: flagellar filament capping protein FliD [Oscillospiraceae bacterium]|nr:flagellar filament capping protein FliD [Oscillospiraceae bacterium]